MRTPVSEMSHFKGLYIWALKIFWGQDLLINRS